MDSPLISAEIDLASIAHNVTELRRLTAPSARLMAVVKANGYGHGATAVALTALQHGADRLGVARIEEAIALRHAGIRAQILIFGYTDPRFAQSLIDHRLTPTLFSIDTAAVFSARASALGTPIRCHIKVDTGMGRIGLLPDSMRPGPRQGASPALLSEIAAVTRLPGLEIEGIYTHLACADAADKTHADGQLRLFREITDELARHGIRIPIRHAANSGALIDSEESHLDMVRPGIALYGLYPSSEVKKDRLILKPAMTLKTRIIQLKTVPPRFKVSYGSTHETDRETRIATVCAGYADGVSRLLSGNGAMLVRGKRAPIVGRVCMDLTMLDVGHIPEAEIGDEVVVFGEQNGARLSADEIAARIGTIHYEVVTGISERVTRVLIDG